MSIFTDEQFAKSGDDAGIFMEDLGRALVTWTAMQNKSVTVYEAAAAFNTTPDIIKQSVEDASWIYVAGDKLELDGE